MKYFTRRACAKLSARTFHRALVVSSVRRRQWLLTVASDNTHTDTNAQLSLTIYTRIHVCIYQCMCVCVCDSYEPGPMYPWWSVTPGPTGSKVSDARTVQLFYFLWNWATLCEVWYGIIWKWNSFIQEYIVQKLVLKLCVVQFVYWYDVNRQDLIPKISRTQCKF